MKNKTIILCLLWITSLCNGQIWLDGNFDDWSTEDILYTDDLNDGQPNGIDLRNIYVTDDVDYLYVSIELGKEISIQSENDLTLLIDTDNNLQTGKKINGIGCEIRWEFGQRRGIIYSPEGYAYYIRHYDLGIITSPTVTSDRLELLIPKDIKYRSQKLFQNTTIALRVEDNANGGDDAPNELKGLQCTFKNIPRSYTVSIDRKNSEDIRILSLNSKSDRLLETYADGAYRRLIQSINPDIIALQELYEHSATQAKRKIQSYVSKSFYAQKVGKDLVLLSKYPILESKNIGGNALHVLQLPEKKLLLSNNHFFCCNKDAQRQEEADILMAAIRDVREGKSDLNIERDCPIVLTGDFNLVGKRETLRTLTHGEIQNNSTYGTSFAPDNDGTALSSAPTYTLGTPSNYTWISTESYSPGKLDYLIYSDATIQKRQSFSLDTRRLSTSQLDDIGLKSQDSETVSDHLPIILDIISAPNNQVESTISLEIYPNPCGGTFYFGESSSIKKIKIFDITGREVSFTVNEDKISLTEPIRGNYFIRLTSNTGKHFWKKIIVI